MAEDRFQINEKPVQPELNDTDAFLLQEDDNETKRTFASTVWLYIRNKLKTISGVIDHKMLSNIGINTHSEIDSFILSSPTTFATFDQGAKADSALQPDSDGSHLINMTKSQVGLSHVDDTADIDKPISTSTQSALDRKENLLVTSTTLWVDSTRSDTYVENGTIARPFKSLGVLSTFISANTVTSACINLACTTYTEADPVILPSDKVIVNGNGAIVDAVLSFTGSKCIMSNITILRPLEFSITSTSARVINCYLDGGVSSNGDITIIDGSVSSQIFGASASKIYIMNSFCDGPISCAGILRINNSECQLGAGSSDHVIVSSSGGQCFISNSIIQNNGTGNAIVCNNGALGYSNNSKENIIFNNVISSKSNASAIDAGSAYTSISKNIIRSGSITGTNFVPFTNDIIGPSKINIGSDAAGDLYFRGQDSSLTRLGIGSNKQLLVSDGSSPKWVDLSSSMSGIPVILNTPNSNIPNGQSLSLLSSGVLKNTATTGLLSIATCDDLADGLDYHLITTAQRTLLGNTSGINTGDQTDIAGNAATATVAETANKLSHSLTINNVSYDGSVSKSFSLASPSDSIMYAIVLG